MSEDAQETVENGEDGEVAETTDESTDETQAEGTETSELVGRAANYDEELAAEVAAVEESVAELEADLAERDEEVDDLESRLKRTQADFQNYKKRAKKRQSQIRERATEDLVERLLDVRDDLNRALDSEYDDVDGLRDGVEMTRDEFDRVLADEDVAEIAPEPGSEVDPQRHEVLMRVESDAPDGTVADVYQPGYEMGEKVLRAAQVTVSEESGDGASEGTENGDAGSEGDEAGDCDDEGEPTDDGEAVGKSVGESADE